MDPKNRRNLSSLGEDNKNDHSILDIEEQEREDQEQAKEKSGASLLSGGNSLTEFFGYLAKNGGVIFHIGSYFIKDKEEQLRNMSEEDRRKIAVIESARGFTIDELKVAIVDGQSKKGYIKINNRIEIPWPPKDIESTNDRSYFFDGKEALNEWERRSNAELKVLELISNTSSKLTNYLKRVIDKKEY